MMRSQSEYVQLSQRSLWLAVGTSAVVAAALFVCLVMPAEFRIDPTGIGRLTGVIRLSSPKPTAVHNVAAGAVAAAAADRYYDSGYRADVLSISLASETPQGGNELEYKVRMKAGQTLVYSWRVAGVEDPAQFYFDFHGESDATPDVKEPQVIEYRQTTGLSSSGMLVAPFDGIFGWYLQNQSAEKITVAINLSGFYALIAPGEYGNEAGVTTTELVPQDAQPDSSGKKIY